MANLTDTKHPSVRGFIFVQVKDLYFSPRSNRNKIEKIKIKTHFNTILLINFLFQNYQVLSHGLGMVNKFGTSLLGIVGSKEELYLTTRGDSN